MTAETDLLPLPEWTKRDDLGGLVPSEVRAEMQAYARANVAHATAAKDAELVELRSTIEALRAEVETWKGIVHDEIAANTAFREAGGAKPDEDMPTFCARILAEVRENRSRKLALAVKYVVHKNRAERLAEVLGRILENEASDWKAAEEFGGYVLDDELREEARDVLRREGWK